MKYEDLATKVLSYNPKADETTLRRAYEFAAEAHRLQKRQSGDPFIVHPLAVAMILAELELDQETIVAALLHDVVEDSDQGLAAIRDSFGEEVALLVDGVTKLGRFEYRSKEEQQAENLRKMLLAMARDIRVILIKLADRLHNLRTLSFLSPIKQYEIAQETLEIFAPLAHRLGIYHLKWEMEDLSFRYLDPEAYHSLAASLAETRGTRELQIQEVINIMEDKLREVGIAASIQGRPKHLYSIYSKMVKQDKDLSDIYDVSGVRIIVNTVRDCYATLGVVHTIFKPLPGRFKDFIAMPKSNMYQSLHTTVVGPKGKPVEIQMRTWEMHRTAEYGIAAHWRYKSGGRGDRQFDAKLAWLRQMMDWQHELRDAREFMESLKIDIFADVVFVFTPHGDVIELPAGSIPIDFAYRIHSGVGHRCIGARVNGRLVPLDYQLQNGDIVEIITAKQPAPRRDWMAMVKTSQARTKIRNWFKKENREENIAHGRELLEREAKKQGVELETLHSEKALKVGRRYTLNSLDDLYAAIGLGSIAPSTVVQRFKDQTRPIPQVVESRVGEQRWSRAAHGVLVKDAGNVLVRLAHCCNPVPGDPILGYITRGRGVSVHRADCRNMAHWQAREGERLVEVMWDEGFDQPFHVRMELVGIDRPGLLGDVMIVLGDMKISASRVSARRGRDGNATIDLTLEVRDLEQLQFAVNKLQRIRDVYEVCRTL